MVRVKNIPIQVRTYSGYKSEEYPTCFFLNDKEYDIIAIRDRWYQLDNIPEFPAADYFKVLTRTNKEFIIKHERSDDQWYLVVLMDPIMWISAN
ncbi:cytoplasmic protein [Sunxiuqinia sp. A32]|uniref:cytoplasmic protein n=1 Tax=Sunxiuqinia sp. A32 TaxID=3461496 RepID=UPI0040458512